MTSPTPQGSPDWSRQAPWSDQVFFNYTGRVFSGAETYTAIYVGNIRALLINFHPNSNVGRLQLRWYADPALSQLVNTDTIDVGAVQRIERTIRPYAPYLQISVGVAGVAPFTYDLYVASVSDVDMPRIRSQSNILIAQTSVAIAAATTVSVAASASHLGSAWWQVYTSGTNYSGTLLTTDFTGAATTFASFTSGAGTAGQRVYLPGGIITATVTNSDAAPHGYWLYLIASGNLAD